MSSGALKLRLWALLSAAVVVPLGFALKLYAGPGQAWVNNSLAGAAYVIFWCLAVFAVWPRPAAITRIASGVFGTSATHASTSSRLWAIQAVRSSGWAARCFKRQDRKGTSRVWQ